MRRQIFCSMALCLLIIGNVLAVSTGFEIDPTFTDTFDDDTYGDYEDIKYIWIANNETFLKFKLEFAAPFNDTISSGIYLIIYISLDNTTGSLINNVMVRYGIRLMTLDPGWDLEFRDYVNASNYLDPAYGTGLIYFLQSNNDKTIEVGVRLKSYYGGQGYLNISLGQRIALKFEMGWTSDWAPNAADWAIPYTLEFPTQSNGIPGFEPVLVLACVFLLLFFYLERRPLPKP